METSSDFEQYWREHREEVLSQREEYRRASENFKMKSGADWLLFAIPVVAGVISFDYIPFERELLKWLCCAVATVICFVVCIWIKSIIAGGPSPGEIEQKLKAEHRERISRR